MAVNRVPVLKRCRSLGLDPIYLGIDKKSTRQLKRANRKMSEYGLQLREKQKAKFIYGVLEKPFRNYYKKADRMPGQTGENLMVMLETRLDNVIFRMGFARTRREARQIVDHKHVLVNNEPKTAYIECEGKGVVTAADIQTDQDIEIMNPDQVIATLNGGKDCRRAMELTITRGRGYVSADKGKTDDMPIGVLEKPFRNYYKKADRMPGQTGENLMVMLETRLDNVIFRMGFARTRREARQIVDHKHVLVNGKCVNIPSYLVKAGDTIEINYKKADRMPGQTGENLMVMLETRLDNVIFRMGFARTRREARQIVDHKHVLVNGKCVNIPSYLVKAGDTIEIKEKCKGSERYKGILEVTGGRLVPEWLDVNQDALSGTVKELPNREVIDVPVDEMLIVELYSK